ncbi:hypothetical protein U1Q18_035402 [Sarracenia purpurea var. burkii]
MGFRYGFRVGFSATKRETCYGCKRRMQAAQVKERGRGAGSEGKKRIRWAPKFSGFRGRRSSRKPRRWASEDGDASSEKLIVEQGWVDSMIRLVSCVEIFSYAGKGISKMHSL